MEIEEKQGKKIEKWFVETRPTPINHVRDMNSLTVSGQNTIGIYITPLVLIQPTDAKQNAVNNNWLLKLQPAVKLQSWQKSNFHQIE